MVEGRRRCRLVGGVVLGYRGPIRQERSPNVTDVDTDVLRNGVVLVDLDGLSHPTGMPSLNAGNEFGSTPLDDMIVVMRVFDDPRLVIITLAAMGFVFFESGGEVPASLSDIHFATCAGDLVDTRSGIRIMSVLVGLGEVPDLVGDRVKDFDVVLAEGPLDLVGGTA